ncbi:hypothetical protein BDN72DRAFT_902941 [Pluteus cervinus]|uniref:Uncharacterized protein n=1 Tax=Pluteus cervinus TaxID=181527 RepID=A0ACD3ABK7_9AGAR|nr:hypothetical protein BDN72DRAFT_902941 [Pluteus cervinus]
MKPAVLKGLRLEFKYKYSCYQVELQIIVDSLPLQLANVSAAFSATFAALTLNTAPTSRLPVFIPSSALGLSYPLSPAPATPAFKPTSVNFVLNDHPISETNAYPKALVVVQPAIKAELGDVAVECDDEEKEEDEGLEGSRRDDGGEEEIGVTILSTYQNVGRTEARAYITSFGISNRSTPTCIVRKAHISNFNFGFCVTPIHSTMAWLIKPAGSWDLLVFRQPNQLFNVNMNSNDNNYNRNPARFRHAVEDL